MVRAVCEYYFKLKNSLLTVRKPTNYVPNLKIAIVQLYIP